MEILEPRLNIFSAGSVLQGEAFFPYCEVINYTAKNLSYSGRLILEDFSVPRIPQTPQDSQQD